MDLTKSFKDEFLHIMKTNYALDEIEVEDYIDQFLESGISEGVSPDDLAEDYAEKYDLTSIGEVSLKTMGLK